MKLCNRCNHFIENPSSQFCPNCGARIDEGEPAYESPTTSKREGVVNKRVYILKFGIIRLKILIGLVVAAVALLTSGFAIFTISRNNLTINDDDFVKILGTVTNVVSEEEYDDTLEKYETIYDVVVAYDYEGKSYEYKIENTSIKLSKDEQIYLYILKDHPEAASESSPRALKFIGQIALIASIIMISIGGIMAVVAIIVFLLGLVKVLDYINGNKYN